MAVFDTRKRRRAAQIALAGGATGAVAGLGISIAQPDGARPPERVELGSSSDDQTTATTLDIEGTAVQAPVDATILGGSLDDAQAAADSPLTDSPNTNSPASASPDSPELSLDTVSPNTVSPNTVSPLTASVESFDVDDDSDNSGPGSTSSGSGSSGSDEDRSGSNSGSG